MITEWVLILTLISGEGVRMEQVRPFASAAQCAAAGQAWLNKTYPHLQNQNWRIAPNYTCMEVMGGTRND